MFRCLLVPLSCLLVLFAAHSGYADLPLVNPSFEQGANSPTGWTLRDGDGGWVTPGANGNRAIAVRGKGADSGAWLSQPIPWKPSTVYRLRFQMRRLEGSDGSAVSGPAFCNRDLSVSGKSWTEVNSYFVSSRNPDREASRIRLGQWHLKGAIAFDDVHIERAIPVHQSYGDFVLGSGEVIHGQRYTFTAPMQQLSSNYSRPLAWHQCSFNSNRWCLNSPHSEVVYKHRLPRNQLTAVVHVEIGWYASGQLIVSAGRDSHCAQRLGTLGKADSASFEIPPALLPAESIWIRLTVEPKPGERRAPSLQVHAYRYEATLDGPPAEVDGATHFVAVSQEDPRLDVAIEGLGETIPGGNNRVALIVDNHTGRMRRLAARVSIGKSGSDSRSFQQAFELPAEASKPLRVEVPYHIGDVGPNRMKITIQSAVQSKQPHNATDSPRPALFAAETTFHVPQLYASNYGYQLPGSNDALGIWWCQSGWKVSARRRVPKATRPAIAVAAAANETDAAQLVLRPAHPITNLSVRVSSLQGPGSSTIQAAQVDVLRVRYVHVARPTDSTGTIGLWPDPLPPIQGPLTLGANQNQPLWVRVHVPKRTPAGVYRGTIQLRGDNCRVDVPLHVTVFGFELPDRMTCQTAFGLNVGTIWKYHGVKDGRPRRAVLAKYLQTLSDHHISPYDPAPLDPIRLTWKNTPPWIGGQRDTDVCHQGHVSLRLADDSQEANVAAHFVELIPIGPKGLTLRFWYRTAKPSHRFIVTLGHYDADHQWMSGRNNDIRIEGNGQWQLFQRTVTVFPKEARSVQLRLWATTYREDGSLTGTVWYDDVSLVDQATGKEAIVAGGFESEEQPTPQPIFDFVAWDRSMTEAIDRYHFNTFRLGITGLGGGTFHDRYAPSLLGYSEETLQYQKAMETYLGQLQSHLRDKGWLDEAFVYWFDEPAPRDYAFVTNGFAKIKRWAPDLRRMLTEQIEPGLIGGPNIWCPLTPQYDQAEAEKRRRQGEDFWWYVCTGPRAPYCTLFIDHPATELRVWLWQTWKRRIQGILVWSSNYWTSSAAYPDPKRPQNPYLDPMGWVSGYSTPKGTRRAWGNGDGRFIYPPESAADGRPATPILEAPVDSIRLEMLRDGIEDYEYLVLLSKRLDARRSSLSAEQIARYTVLLDVPKSISEDLTHFTTGPSPIQERRTEIARAIEALRSQAGG